MRLWVQSKFTDSLSVLDPAAAPFRSELALLFLGNRPSSIGIRSLSSQIFRSPHFDPLYFWTLNLSIIIIKILYFALNKQVTLCWNGQIEKKKEWLALSSRVGTLVRPFFGNCTVEIMINLSLTLNFVCMERFTNYTTYLSFHCSPYLNKGKFRVYPC